MRPILALLALLGLPLAAAAQPSAPAAPPAAPLPETTLHIAETAEVMRAPDELVAVLRAEARAGSAAAAQEAVNRAMSAALMRAAGRPGTTASTGAYWTARLEEGRVWQASQTLTLRSGEGPALLELVGALQGQGLAVVSLRWGLTREAARLAREEAARLALDTLRRRAEAVAGQLGLGLAGLREVRIDAPDRSPRPMAMAATAARAATAPVAAAEDEVVAATVEAVAILRPR